LPYFSYCRIWRSEGGPSKEEAEEEEEEEEGKRSRFISVYMWLMATATLVSFYNVQTAKYNRDDDGTDDQCPLNKDEHDFLVLIQVQWFGGNAGRDSAVQ
jgi:hypothetical protein